MNEHESRDDEAELAQALFRTLFVEGVSFHSSTLIPALTATVRALGYRKRPEPEWGAARSHWQVIRGAQTDMLNGRPDMDALEEIALSSAGLDELLGAAGPWEPIA